MNPTWRVVLALFATALLAFAGCTDTVGTTDNDGEQPAQNDQANDNGDPDQNDNDDPNQDDNGDPNQNDNDDPDQNDNDDPNQDDNDDPNQDDNDDPNQDDNDDPNQDDNDDPNQDNNDCEAETDDQLCEQAGYECGEADFVDDCGEDRTVDCGGCPDDDCSDNTCGCTPLDCTDLADTCGVQSDGCGGEILCSTDCANPIGIGAYHTCLMQEGGGVECFGWNDSGQLGVEEDDDGDDIDYSANGVTVDDLDAEILQVFAGEQHTCAKDIDGNVYCWGDNSYNQLTDLAGDESAEPVEITNIDGAANVIGTGGFHTCAELNPGDMQCWGENWDGQLGTGDNDWYETPQDVLWDGSTDDPIAKFDGGPWFSCYQDGDDDLYCWGENTFGQIGNEYPWDGSTGDLYEPTEVVVDIESPIVDFSAGGTFDTGSGAGYTISGFTCAIDDTDSLYCWGYNGYGQLGIDPDDQSTNHHEEAQEIDVDDPTQVVAGGEHACAIDVSGDVYCWGYNEYGQLGDGSFDDSHEPVEVENLDGHVVEIFAGTFHTCALINHGDFKCWGLNSDGQLGDGTTTNRNEPVSVFE